MSPDAPATEPPAVELTRELPASCGTLYRCFTEPRHIEQWFGPEGVDCEGAEVDARVDGRYRIVMRTAEGKPAIVGGRFLELDPPHHIRMTWLWEETPSGATGEESLVTLRIEPAGGGARLTLRHERIHDPDNRRSHAEGWTRSLDGLAAYAETLA
jgi:uncharacterized protein YndB with AHSA1/START domain